MSVLAQPYAVPSRVLGVYRHLLRSRGQRDAVDSLCRFLAPESLPRRGTTAEGSEEGGGRDMVRETVNECVGMGLLARDGEEGVRLSPDLPPEGRKPESAEAVFPITLTSLFFARENQANHDLGVAIAWYLAQDAYDAPGNWPTVDEALRTQVGGDRLRITNDARYGNFEDWACFLGFAWTHTTREKTVMTPDPTLQLKLRLREVLPGKPRVRHAVSEVVNRLAHLCPVLEGGFLRAEAEKYVPSREPQHLSAATALAWLRLRDEGYLDFSHESDANVYILPDGDRSVAVSHLALREAA